MFKLRALSFTGIAALAALLISACSSTPKPYEPAANRAQSAGEPEKPYSTGSTTAVPLTKSGENYRPAFSPDGNRLIFVSENREAHVHLQAYEIDLKTKAERRITFNDADVYSAIYHPNGKQILYSAATDELKEGEQFIGALRKRFDPVITPETSGGGAADQASSQRDPKSVAAEASRLPGTLEATKPFPSELYISSTNGSGIDRLTTSSGIDAYPTISPDGRQLVFSSSRGGRRDLFRMNVQDGRVSRLTTDAIREIDPSFSKDGKNLAFCRVADDNRSAQIYVTDSAWKKASMLTTKTAFNLSPAWNPNGESLVFSSNRDDGKSFDLWSVETKNGCLKRITTSSDNEIFPAFSPDGTKLAFASNHGGHYQIYMMDYQPAGDCLSEAP